MSESGRVHRLEQMVHHLQGQISRLYRRTLMTTAGVTISSTDDTGPVHKVQGKVRGTPETIDNLQVVQLYGVAGHAPVGSDGLVLFGNGDRSNGCVMATHNQAARPRNQKPGEVTIFTDEGDTIALQRNNIIVITTKTVTINSETAVNINANSIVLAGKGGGNTTVAITGDLNVSGVIDADEVTATTINAPNGHVGP